MKRWGLVWLCATVVSVWVGCGESADDGGEGGNNAGTNNSTNNSANNAGNNANNAENNSNNANNAENNAGNNANNANNAENNVNNAENNVNNAENNTNNANNANNGSICDQIPSAENVGQDCSQQEQGFCGDGGACVTLSQDVAPSCAQACIPQQCTEVCDGDEVCVGLIDANGDPIEANGVPLGACAVPPSGEQGAYDRCGQEAGNCQAGFQCGILQQGDEEGLCLPECDGQGSECPSREGVEGMCVITTAQGQPPSACALICDAAGDGTGEGCPEGMTCTVIGNNPAGLCLW